MQDFVFFIGRFHVLLLHFPIAFAMLVILTEGISRLGHFRWLNAAIPLLWACTAISAILTMLLGLMHISEGGFTGAAAGSHRLWGIALTLTVTVIWLFSSFKFSKYKKWSVPLCLLVFLQVIMTGHYGGMLTHGSTYLVEYAPTPLRNLAGLPPRREAITDVARADPWFDVVAPVLQKRCVSCHNPDRKRGLLNLASLEALMVGGENGQIVVSGNKQASELYYRITLPETDDSFMPAEGKTPLTLDEVALIGWWLDAGLPANTTVSELAPDTAITTLLTEFLGLGFDQGSDMGTLPVLNSDLLSTLENTGFLIRPLSEQQHGYRVINEAPGLKLDEPRLAALVSAAPAIVMLDLSGSAVTSENLRLLSDFDALQTLNLSNNLLDDNNLEILATLPELQVLNLYGNNSITDAGLETLIQSSSLQTVYLWGTGVTENTVTKLRENRPDLELIGIFD